MQHGAKLCDGLSACGKALRCARSSAAVARVGTQVETSSRAIVAQRLSQHWPVVLAQRASARTATWRKLLTLI
eukprot:5757487-Amphidinium_carterae.1